MDPTLEQFQFVWAAAGEYGVKLLAAVVIWFVGTTLSKLAGNGARRVLRTQEDIDPSVENFTARAIQWIGLIVIGVLVLNVFGINTTSIAAMLGAMTLAIGLALRDTLSNVAAGLMILMVRPFLTGHYVEIGTIRGTVRSINLFTTELATLDNIKVLVPNKEAWQSPIKNFSGYDRRRLDMVVGIDYGSDADRAIEIIKRLIEADPRTIMEPEPFVRVTELGQSSVNITLRVWCMRSDRNDMKFDLTKAIKERFDHAGIAIPYPHMELILKEMPEAPRGPGRLATAGTRGGGSHHH